MEWNDAALVLCVGQFRERDVWLRLLTRHHGVVHVFAFGGSRSRQRFPGCLDLLNRLSIRVVANRTGQFLNLAEGCVLSGPRRLRSDTARLGVAMNCLRFVEALGVLAEESQTAFDLTCAMLDVLESEESMPEFLPLWFRFRLAADQGYVPDFAHCAKCGADLVADCRNASWRASDGLVRCASCADGHGAETMIRPAMLAALTAIREGSPETWRVEGLPAGDRRELAGIVDELLEYHVGLTWSNGRFVRA